MDHFGASAAVQSQAPPVHGGRDRCGRLHRFRRCFPLILIAAGLWWNGAVHGEMRPEFAMDANPGLKLPAPVPVYSPRLKTLWLAALWRPEADLQRQAAETIAQAHLAGVPELIEAQPALIAIVSAESSHPAARVAAARALIALDARESARPLYEASLRNGIGLRLMVEPALAQWKFEPMRAIWEQRLSASDSRPVELSLAIQGLVELSHEAAVPALLQIAFDRLRPAAVRLAAARGAGKLQTAGLEDAAARFVGAAAVSIPDRLCAAGLLERHRSERAQGALGKLAQDEEPGVAALALASLNAIDPELVVPLGEQSLRNADANVRRQGIKAYVARPTPERVTLLAAALDDPHPGLRAWVCEALHELASTAELDGPIRQAAIGVLQGQGWRGQEQAALLLGTLDHKPAAARLVELLESPRPEVMIASAWGLRKLAIPETLPAALEKAQRQTEARLVAAPETGLDKQVGHLFEFLGQSKYAAAEPLMKRYVPKEMILGEYSRSAAIWALGQLHADERDEPLALQFVERLTDPAPPPVFEPAEFMRVRVASALAIARLGVTSQIPRMRKYMEPVIQPIPSHLAIIWAIKELTGEVIPSPEPAPGSQGDWFLEPIAESSAAAP